MIFQAGVLSEQRSPGTIPLRLECRWLGEKGAVESQHWTMIRGSECLFKFLTMLLSANIERVSVSHVLDFSSSYPLNNRLRTLALSQKQPKKH